MALTARHDELFLPTWRTVPRRRGADAHTSNNRVVDLCPPTHQGAAARCLGSRQYRVLGPHTQRAKGIQYAKSRGSWRKSGNLAAFSEFSCCFARFRIENPAESGFNHRVPLADGRIPYILKPRMEGVAEMAKAAPKKAAKPLTKSQVLANIAETAGLSKKEVAAVFDALSEEIKKNIAGNKGPGAFVLPGLVKIEKKRLPAQPAQKNVPNPFRPGELMDRPAKPARNKIKVRPLKNLKDMI